MSGCLARHGLPRTPADLGLSHAEFTKAVLYAPATRPGRYTILERLALDECAIARQVDDFALAVANTAVADTAVANTAVGNTAVANTAAGTAAAGTGA